MILLHEQSKHKSNQNQVIKILTTNDVKIICQREKKRTEQKTIE